MTLRDVKLIIKRWTDRDNRWLSLPVTAVALIVLLVFVKSCQGIAYYRSDEGKLCRTGYPKDAAHAIAAALTPDQVDTLAQQGFDSVVYEIVNQRYFIAENTERYVAFHKSDTAGMLPADIVAMVNVGADRQWKDAVPCDTSKGHLMLINRSHYVSEHHKDSSMVAFVKDYAFGENMAVPAVVDAFYKMREDCLLHTLAHLMVSSSYRSYNEQHDTHKQYSSDLVAKAGFSEHQTGLSLDIVTEEHLKKWEFGESTEGKWIRDHCHEYGFILRYPEGKEHITGYSYEPWHLRYVGKDVAKLIHDEGITFDEYYAYYIERR